MTATPCSTCWICLARMELAENNREAQALRYEWLIEVLKECTAEEREALLAGEDALEHAADLARYPEKD